MISSGNNNICMYGCMYLAIWAPVSRATSTAEVCCLLSQGKKKTLICVKSLTSFTQVITSSAALLLPFLHTSLHFLFFHPFPLSSLPLSDAAGPRGSRTEFRSSFVCLCSFMETSSADGVQSSLPRRPCRCRCF